MLQRRPAKPQHTSFLRVGVPDDFKARVMRAAGARRQSINEYCFALLEAGVNEDLEELAARRPSPAQASNASTLSHPNKTT